MVLSSQMNRPGSVRRVPSHGRSPNRRRIVTLIFLAAVTGGVWYWWSEHNTSQPNIVNAPDRGSEDDGADSSRDSESITSAASGASSRTTSELTPGAGAGRRANPEPAGGVLSIDGKAAAPTDVPASKTPGREVMTGKAGGQIRVGGATPLSSSGAPTAGTDKSTPPTPSSPANVPGASGTPAPAGAGPSTTTPPPHSPPRNPALAQGMKLIEDGRYVEGRLSLSRLLFAQDNALNEDDAQTIRTTLASVNKELIFSRDVAVQDPLVEPYTIQPGDLFARLAPRCKLPAEALEVINGIDGRRLQVGQKVKLVRGPFHARVVKSAFRMDLMLNTAEGEPIYIRSFTVGLGEKDSTPLGSFIVRQGGKVANPDWSNPRTREYFKSDDPKNPIGEYWLALDGTDEHTKTKKGYGIHGTIDQDSIGKMMSMGCVRMRDADIALVFKLLTDNQTTVRIEP